MPKQHIHKTHQINVRLTEHEFNALRQKAEEVGVTVSAALRDLFTAWLKDEFDPYGHLKRPRKHPETGEE